MNSILFSFLLLMFAGCGVSFGSQDQAGSDVESPVISSPLESLDNSHSAMSDMIEATAKRFDRFFAEDRVFEETNETSVKIRLDLISEEGGLLQFENRVRAKLSLPATERRLRLIIDSDPDEIDPNALESNPIDELNSISDYIIGLEGERLMGGWQIRPSVGIKWRWPVKPYVRLRAVRYFDLDKWLARVSATAAWFSSEGKSIAGTTGFDHRLSDYLLFRSTTSARWEIDDSETSTSQVFTLFQRLASKASLAYDIGVVGDDESGWRVTDQFIRLRYRRLLYKSWAYLEIQPMVAWPEDNDYREDFSLQVRLELNYGREYL